jgi:hypothetical protein
VSNIDHLLGSEWERLIRSPVAPIICPKWQT